MRIAQLAKVYGPRSSGLRTALHHLGAGYAGRGHEVMTVAAPTLPGTGGYQLVDPWPVTLRGLGPWARQRDVPGVVISHERPDRLLRSCSCRPARPGAAPTRQKARTAAAYDPLSGLRVRPGGRGPAGRA